jgi:uncharacterized protein YneF (UPF0154 family)
MDHRTKATWLAIAIIVALLALVAGGMYLLR